MRSNRRTLHVKTSEHQIQENVTRIARSRPRPILDGRSVRTLQNPKPQHIVEGFGDQRDAERLIRPLDASADPLLQEARVLLDRAGEVAEVPERSHSVPVRPGRRRHRRYRRRGRARAGAERGDRHGGRRPRRRQGDRRRRHLVGGGRVRVRPIRDAVDAL